MWQSLSKGHFSPQLVFPIGKLEQHKYVWNDYSLYVMSTVSNSVNTVNSYSAVLPPSPMVFFPHSSIHRLRFFGVSREQFCQPAVLGQRIELRGMGASDSPPPCSHSTEFENAREKSILVWGWEFLMRCASFQLIMKLSIWILYFLSYKWFCKVANICLNNISK